jgi:dethiobiotin synthetase
VIDVFLTGTAPGVGKTRVAGLYAQEAIARGRTPGFLKPAQTGRTDDALAVAAAAAGTVCATGYRYLAALAPGIDGIIIEGGGLLEPLGEATTFADLAVAVGLPLVIVTRPDRAALSIVALTVEAAAARGIEVAGIAITGCAHKPDLGERTTRAELGRIAPVLGSLPLEPVAG